MDDQVLLALSIWSPTQFKDRVELEQISTNVLRNQKLESGDMLFVLSSNEPVGIDTIEVGNEAMLVVAQLPLPVLQQFAIGLGVEFAVSEYGVYKKAFRPGRGQYFISDNLFQTQIRPRLDLFTKVRNNMWILYGIIATIGTLHGRTLDAHDLEAGKWKAASAHSVQRLKRKVGYVSEEDCGICCQSLSVTELDCQHHFHSTCVGDWLLEHADSCPLCRKSIGP